MALRHAACRHDRTTSDSVHSVWLFQPDGTELALCRLRRRTSSSGVAPHAGAFAVQHNQTRCKPRKEAVKHRAQESPGLCHPRGGDQPQLAGEQLCQKLKTSGIFLNESEAESREFPLRTSYGAALLNALRFARAGGYRRGLGQRPSGSKLVLCRGPIASN